VGGLMSFRVPTLHELHTLVNDGAQRPALALPPFKAMGAVTKESATVWSSTNLFEKSGQGLSLTYVVDFQDGHTTIGDNREMLHVRCVR
jgi:hypothetical protein